MIPSLGLMCFLCWWEGLPGGKPALKAYPDGGGEWTIGFGRTAGVKQGDVCSQTEAEEWLIEEVKAISDKVTDLVVVQLAQNEFDAIISFAYNVGLGALESSTLLKRVNKLDLEGAVQEFRKWVRDNGKTLPGLVRRREAEIAMFELGDYSKRP